MKTLYSSTFLSVVLGFLILLDQSGKLTGQFIERVESQEETPFRTIVERPDLLVQEDGKVHVDVFTAFTCQNCRNFGLGTTKELQQTYGKDEKIDLKIHLTANKEDEMDVLATKAAQCAGDQQKFSEMLQKLYEMEAITAEEIAIKAEEIKLDQTAFDDCLKGEGVNSEIDEALKEKEAQKIDMIPSTLVDNTLLIGAHPVENVEREIRQNL